MKKILLGTTALVGLFASAAFAEAPTVTVGGSIDFQAGMAQQKSTYETDANSRDGKFANDTRVDVKVNGKADNGLGYGAEIRLQADTSAADDNSGLNADRTFIFVDSNAGRVEAGSNVGVAKSMKVDASTFARASGGVDGDWYRFANEDIGGDGVSTYILTPDLPTDAGKTERGDTENATKVSYYTPRHNGLQLGVGFTPDTGNRGTAQSFSSKYNTGDYGNVWEGGLNYTGKVHQVGIGASLTGEIGHAENADSQDIEDLRAYAAGLDLTYANFTLGGSYGNWGHTGQTTGEDAVQDYWTIGGAYVQGPVGASLTYLNSRRDNNDFYNVSLGADYQLAPGLVPYAEVSFFQLTPADSTVEKNKGTVFLLGTQLNF